MPRTAALLPELTQDLSTQLPLPSLAVTYDTAGGRQDWNTQSTKNWLEPGWPAIDPPSRRT